jgi:3-oxoacyl-[acyl-carrier-protein] synthase-3
MLSIKNVRIAGLAGAVPALGSDGLSNGLKRRAAKPGVCHSDYCLEAGQRLLAGLGWDAGGIGAVVMATVTPDYIIPPTAILLQDRLHVAKTAVAFDLPSRDLGFLHALQVGASMIANGRLTKALVFAGGVSRAERDLNHVCAAGHNGVACALEYAPGCAEMLFDCGGDGAEEKAFYMPVGGSREPAVAKHYADAESARKSDDYFIDTSRVDAAGRRELPAAFERLLEAGGKSAAKIDALCLHSLGSAAADEVCKEVGVAPEKVFDFAAEYGDCASGAIPIAMIAGSAARLTSGESVVLVGGVAPGLAWGGALLTTDRIVCPDLIEL